MSGRVARRGFHHHAIVDRVVAFQQQRLPGLEHGQHAVVVHLRASRALHPPIADLGIEVLLLDPREQVPGVRERRYPAAVLELRVPADMVGVEVRAQHDVDVLGRNAHRAQALQERDVEHVEARQPRPRLVVAGTAVEEDGVSPGANQPGVVAGDELVARRIVVDRRHPRQVRREPLAHEPGQELLGGGVVRAHLLLDPRHRGAAQRPCLHCFAPFQLRSVSIRSSAP